MFLLPWLVKEYAKNVLRYGKNATEDKKKRATFFYVFAYFLTLARVLKIDPKSLKLIDDSDKERIERVFKDFESNKKILGLVNETVEKFLDDSAVLKISKKDGWDDFFKGHADDDDIKNVFLEKLEIIEDGTLKNIGDNFGTSSVK